MLIVEHDSHGALQQRVTRLMDKLQGEVKAEQPKFGAKRKYTRQPPPKEAHIRPFLEVMRGLPPFESIATAVAAAKAAFKRHKEVHCRVAE
jgi:hypothetical protein